MYVRWMYITEATFQGASMAKRLQKSNPAARDERFTARLSASDKSLLQRAAELHGQTLSAYVFGKARSAAMEDLEAAGEIVLADDEQHRFIELVVNPPEPNSRLRRAVRDAQSVARKK
jgi:uncharacterized protein (DUF1778 family)